MKKVLQSYLGLIRLPCLRTKPSDEKYIYTLQQNVSNPSISMVSGFIRFDKLTNFNDARLKINKYCVKKLQLDNLLPG